MGAATVSAMTSADAPAYVAFTTTVGGAISGYSVMGRARKEIAPTRVSMIEMTPAKIGRSIKKWENRIMTAPLLRRPATDPATLYWAAASILPSSVFTF